MAASKWAHRKILFANPHELPPPDPCQQVFFGVFVGSSPALLSERVCLASNRALELLASLAGPPRTVDWERRFGSESPDFQSGSVSAVHPRELRFAPERRS